MIPLSFKMAGAREEAKNLLDEFPRGLKQDLLKEAAALGDAQTVDKILALNFINPENVGTFANYLPELDEALSKVAEMLVASRLGLNQVPEGALEKSLTGLDTVIDGLRKLHQKSML